MIKLALIGAGGRGWDLARQVLSLPQRVHIAAIVDPDEPAVRARISAAGASTDGMAFYQNLDSFMEHADHCDGLIIASRCSTHTDLAVRVATLGKPLFLEKPIAITMEQLEKLHRAYQNRMDQVVVSFPLRLTPLFQAVLAVIASGRLGSINQVQAFNNVPYGGVYFGQWYRDYQETGGLWLQKATHDFDYINLLVAQRPVMVAAVGTRAIYGGSRPCNLRCSACPDTATCPESPAAHLRRADDGGMANGRPGADHACAFSECIKHDDASSAIIVYENGVHASYAQNFVSRRSAARRGAVITGYQATLMFDWAGGPSQVIDHFEKRVQPIELPAAEGGHGGGDGALLSNFIDVIQRKQPSRSSLRDGFLSATMCIAATESAATHTFRPIRQW